MKLEEKILEAKKLGLKFKLVPKGEGLPASTDDVMYIAPTWNDKMFENELDKKIARFKESTFLSILAKHKLI